MISRSNFKLLSTQQCVCHYFLLNNVNIMESVFVISGMIKVSVLKCYQPVPLAQLILLTTTLIKTSSNNSLILSAAILGVDPWEPQAFSQWHSQQMPQPPHKSNISPLKSNHFHSPLGQSWFRSEPRSQSAVFQGTSKL